ncbi:TPA: LTA synthase family protein [Neisseria gonorrhoeae]
MVAYAFLFLFVTAAVLLIVRSHYRWTYFFASALFVFLAGGMLMLTAQWQRALNFASVWFVVLILFHRLKIHYYKQPLLISDFLLIADWRNWETLFHYKEAVIGMAGLLALAAYAVFGWSGADSLGMPWRWAGAVLFAAVFVSVRHFSKHPGAVKTWLDSLPDDGRDVFLNLPMSCRAVFFQVPVFEGDGEAFARQMPSETRPYGMSDEKPDIVVTLMESTLDPHCFDFAAAKIPDLKMFGRQEDTVFSSPLRVHTFGGATWKSEFAFLAGVPSTDFGALASGVFYSVVPHLQTGFVRNLREHGYFCVALSPFTKGNYNAKAAYDHFGFNLMFQPQDLGYPAPMGKNLWHISSEEMMQYARMILEKRHPDLENVRQPMFVYVLTMKEHGPYRTDTDNVFDLDAPDLNAKTVSALNDYIGRIADLDKAVESFDRYLHERGKPFVFGYFGDHQVPFEGVSVRKKWDYAQPDYVTQFAVRSNIAGGFVQRQDFLDLAFAGGVLMEAAGLEAKDGFMRANMAMRGLCGGGLEDCPNRELVGNYRNYLYDVLKIAR